MSVVVLLFVEIRITGLNFVTLPSLYTSPGAFRAPKSRGLRSVEVHTPSWPVLCPCWVPAWNAVAKTAC